MSNFVRSILLSCFVIMSSTSFASEQQSYGSKVGDKALNGIANLTTAILEIPKSIINITNDSNIFLGTVGGLAKGILNTVGRMATGMTDLVTAPLITRPIVSPAYVWDDFDAETTYGKVFRVED